MTTKKIIKASEAERKEKKPEMNLMSIIFFYKNSQCLLITSKSIL
jgi:hypothetical protein